MAPVIAVTFEGFVLGWGLTLLSLFLILLVLVQRGRGGGLTGALGGPGGQSAFGTKAGDMFTKITSVTALIWIFLCAYTVWLLGAHSPPPERTQTSSVSAPADEDTQEQRGPDILDDLMSGESDPESDAEAAPGGLSDPASPDAFNEAEVSDEPPADAEGAAEADTGETDSD